MELQKCSFACASFILSSMFFVVEMTAQIRIPRGNFHRAFCFNSVKIIFLCSMSCQIGQTPFPEQFRKFDFSELMCKGTSPFCGAQKKHISFPLPWNAVTRLKQQIAVTNIQLVTSQHVFPWFFSAFWNYFFLCQGVLQTDSLRK